MKVLEFDTLIVGGGIVGAGIFRDLNLNNQNCLLIEKEDFGSQTSSKSSKMLHGGIRYLENLDFALVWEALHEKNHWKDVTPHLCKEKKFFLPNYKTSKYPLFAIKAGLKFYDILSGLKNTNSFSTTLEETTTIFPGINTQNLSGCGVYYDVVVDDLKMVLECIYDVKGLNNSKAFNYNEFKSTKNVSGKYESIIFNKLTGVEYKVISNALIFALGPFTDKVLANISELDWSPVLIPSKGSHLWLSNKKLSIKEPLVIQSKDDRVIFVIPHRDYILLGTTEENISGDFSDLKVSTKEKVYLLEEMNNLFPNANFEIEDIIGSYAGVRPLVRGSNLSLKKTARNHKIFNPAVNMYAVAGGKYTTFRVIAKDLIKELAIDLCFEYDSKLNLGPFRKLSIFDSFYGPKKITKELLIKSLKEEYVTSLEDLVFRRIGVIGNEAWLQESPLEELLIEIIKEKQVVAPFTESDVRELICSLKVSE